LTILLFRQNLLWSCLCSFLQKPVSVLLLHEVSLRETPLKKSHC